MVSDESHLHLVGEINNLISEGAKARGIGRGARPQTYLASKIAQGLAIIALHESGALAGFCYVDSWEDGKFAANSGFIVAPEYRKLHLGAHIKNRAFDLAREKYPEAQIVAITSNAAVMHMNHKLGYQPVGFSELPQSEQFWAGCNSCAFVDILQRTQRKHCLCTAMKLDPSQQAVALNDVAQPQRVEDHILASASY